MPEKDPTKKMEVFYNPVMRSQRNITLTLLNAVANTRMNIADPLAGSGIRSLRFLKELGERKCNHLFVNDVKEHFPHTFKTNALINKLSLRNVSLFSEDASEFLMNRIHDKKKPEGFCGYFDYIDLDPFGTPNPFLTAAIARIARKGILAVTATDTAALSGTYPSVTLRKYWATSLRNVMMHETGLRILIRKVQLIGVQFEKALIPVLGYHKDHYFRVFFRVEKGKEYCDALMKQHQYLLFNPSTLGWITSRYNKDPGYTQYAGPLWTGPLQDKALVKKMRAKNKYPEEQKFLGLLAGEKDCVGFYDIHALAKKHHLPVPGFETLLQKLAGTRTHFSPYGIKTGKSLPEVVALLRKGT